MPVPTFTIITSTFNAASTLPRLLDSLASQSCRDFQWVVQDGASTDETVAIVETWRKRLPSISLESAPDKGIYDAWNRALERVGSDLGQWVLFLGADDLLDNSDVLIQVKTAIHHMDAGVRFVNGDLLLFDDSSSISQLFSINIAQSFAKRYYMRMPFAHPALFTSREIFTKDRFDTSFRIAGDYEWALRTWVHECEAQSLNFAVTRMSQNGISNNSKYSALMRKEMRFIIWHCVPWTLKDTPFFCYLLCESYLHGCKMHFKTSLTSSTWGLRFWGTLRELRKTLLEKI